MSWLLLIATVAAFTMIFSEFGGKLRASSALSWWLIAGFLLAAAIVPSTLIPITQALGITLVSNLVLATTIVFLFLQVFSLSALHTAEARKLRSAISKLAAETFLKSNPDFNHKKNTNPSALVILPCYNEEAAIPTLVPEIEKLKIHNDWTINYCFIDDGSTDQTRTVLTELAPNNFVPHLVNNNVSGVLLTGFHIAILSKFDFVIQCDGDGQHPISEIPRILYQAHHAKADLLIASRFVEKHSLSAGLESTTKLRRSGSLLLIALLRTLWPKLKCTDPTSGFRVYSNRIIKLLTTQMPDEFPEPETLALAALHRMKVVETPVTMAKRTTGLSSLHGFKSFIYMYKAISALIGLRLRNMRK